MIVSMNLSKLLLYTFLLLLLPATAIAVELSQGEQDTIFIGAVSVQPSIVKRAKEYGRTTELQRMADALESQFVAALSATRVFQIVERKPAATPTGEGELKEEAIIPAENAAARTGKQAGARFALLVRIDGFEYSAEPVHYESINRSGMQRKLFLSALVQIVDTISGKLLPEAPGMQLTKSEESENSEIVGSDRAIVALAKEMAKILSQEAVSLLRPAKVLAVNGKQVLINRGTESGFQKGDLVTLYATQKVKDADSGEVFTDETPVGQAILTRLDKKQSFANISGEDLGITKGTIVRKLKGAAARRAEEESQPPDPTMPDLEPTDPAATTPGSSEKPLKWK